MKYFEASILSVLSVFAPVKATLMAAAALILADLVLGVYSAYVRKIPITSAGLRRTITKLFVYELTLMMGFLAGQYLTDTVPFVKLIAGLIAVTEMKSILENADSASGGSVMKSLIDRLGSENQNSEGNKK